ncbi:lactate utilization protein C [Dechloromonas sp. XY25]|uniref:Lactate utilization protein C n=1 Tax=Dechloromonas hankyongensis TaxID=2908002 RepID=A0ABS9K6N9_9RHOO|nr:lactate utilization protein C [Dechloromonas hankyongensis]MCG2578785.1 lactate utilization protein C [Dechloromonas hankyongensis]
MSARDDILGRVRQGVGKGDFVGRRAAAEAMLRAPLRGPQPAISGSLVERFRVKAESLASTLDAVADRQAVPAAVAAYLTAAHLPLRVVVTPNLGNVDWSGRAIASEARGAVDADQVGVTGCFCAVAETGTLMLLSGPDSPATVSLLPETHIALVDTTRIVATMEEAFALLRVERGEVPRAVNFVSGPSRTGDIEQTIVLGAHGPCRVHLILIGNPS